MALKESFIFPLKCYKPGLHLLHCSQHYLPSSNWTSHRALNTQWFFKPKVPNFFHKPPQNMVRLSQEYPTMLVLICLSQGFYSCTKHHDQEANWGGKGLFGLHFLTAVHHQRKSGLELKQVRKQELMQRPWRDVLYWLASSDLLSLLSYRTQDYQPRDGPTHKGPFPLDH